MTAHLLAIAIAEEARDLANRSAARQMTPGPRGDPGRDGRHGLDGNHGRDGGAGRDGIDGRDGLSGRDGRDGLAGSDGRGMSWRGEWAADARYAAADAVHHDGSAYIAVADSIASEPGPDAEEWELLAAAGKDGKHGRHGNDYSFGGGVPTIQPQSLFSDLFRGGYYDECDFTSQSRCQGVVSNVSGTVAATADFISQASHPGIVELSTGTDTNGRAAYMSGVEVFMGGSGALMHTTIFNLSVLSDGTDTYTFRGGFADSVSATPTDGIYVRYTHGTNSGKFEFVTVSNTTETATDTGITVTANAWYRVEINLNAAGTRATCTINGTLVATSTTNIPTGASRVFGQIPADIRKSAGTTARKAYIDYYRTYAEFLTQR